MEELNTKYKLKTRTIICTEYNQFLYDLYLPLIGPKAVFLYNFLVSRYEYGDKKISLEQLIKKSGMNLQDFIFERKMLESIGLINFYEGDKEAILVINAILSPKNFFNDDVLKGLYINQVGEKAAYEVIKHYEIDDDSEGLNDVTSSINDNFSINFDFDSLKVGEDVKLASTNKVQRVDDFDDVTLIKYLTKKTNIKAKSITPEELKKVHDTGVLFSLDEKIMAEILTDSFDPMKPFGQKVDLENVTKRAKSEVIASKSYNKRHKKPKIVKMDSDSEVAKKVEYYQSLSPRDFLKETQNGVEPVGADLDIITYLSENMQFDFPVINVILDYALQNCDNQLNRKYVEKIASSLKRNGVTNALEAIAKLYSGKKKTTTSDVNNDKIDSEKEDVSDIEDIADLF